MRAGWLLGCAWMLAVPVHAEDDAESVRMSLDRYRQLMLAASRHGGATVTWDRARVSVTLPDEVGRPARVQLSGQVRVLGDGPAEVPLLPAEAVLVEASVGGNSGLMRVAGAHVAVVESAGSHGVSLAYLVPTAFGGDGGPFAMVPLPPIPGASVEVTNGSDISVWPGTGEATGGRNLTTSIGATPAMLVRWGAAAGGQAVRRVDYTLQPDAKGDGVDVSATFEVRAEGAKARVRLFEADAALVDVREGNLPVATRVVDGWHTAEVTGKGRHVLSVKFRLAVDRSQGQPQVTLNPDNAPIARVEMVVPGKREVQFEPPVPVQTEIRGETTRTVAHLPPTEEVAIRWTEARGETEDQVKFNTDTTQLLTLEEGGLNSRVVVDYDVIQGKTKVLRVALPDDVVLYKVQADGIEDWHVVKPGEELPRHARIVLGRELEGDLRLELQLEMKVKTADGTPLELPVVRPLGAFRERGVVALFDGDKVGFAPATADGYTQVGQDALPADIRQTLRDSVNQAYKHVNAPGAMRSKVATAQTREVHFDARVDTLY